MQILGGSGRKRYAPASDTLEHRLILPNKNIMHFGEFSSQAGTITGATKSTTDSQYYDRAIGQKPNE